MIVHTPPRPAAVSASVTVLGQLADALDVDPADLIRRRPR
jgi:hypothetical protein